MPVDIPFDVICIGRLGIDLYPEQIGVSLAEVKTFSKSLGGSPTNVAVGLAKLGRRVALFSGVGEDGFGDYAKSELESYGVKATWVRQYSGHRTPMVFASIFPPDNFPMLFYRDVPAPDELVETRDLDRGAITQARLLWVTGGSLAVEPVRTAVLSALSWRKNKDSILDLDWRPSQWSAVSNPAEYFRSAMVLANTIIGNEEEYCRATGTQDIDSAISVVEGLGAKTIVVKKGPNGVMGKQSGGDWTSILPRKTDVICGLGAGDAFGAAFMHGKLANWPLEKCLKLANVAGSIVASRLHCAAAMPQLSELEAAVAE